MTVYIEYAFLENFIFDGTLLWLSCKGSRTPIYWRKILCSACIGGVFAVVFPLLYLSPVLKTVCKLSFGLLMCLIISNGLKTRKERGRYALNVVFFFLLTFAFGGALLGVMQESSMIKYKNGIVGIGFALLTVLAVVWIERLYQKRAIERCIYDCEVRFQENAVQLRGFFDSGNLATKNGLPVCFISPDVVFDVWEKDNPYLDYKKQWGQVCDEICFTTLSGEKKVRAYKGSIEIVTPTGVKRCDEVYFALSTNMISREYKLILNSRIFD